jgi:Domain of unknown function (DUF4276)
LSYRIAPIVEGFGDVEAVPILIRRIAAEIDPSMKIIVQRPFRVPRSKLVKDGEIERAVEFVARATGPQGGVLVLVDSDDDCPATLGPALLSRAKIARSDRAIGVVLAKYEFEAWFIAAAESLRGCRRLATDLIAPSDPEAIRDAKSWLSNHMPQRSQYREVLDQPALTALFDLPAARAAPSFDKCWRELTGILNDLRRGASSS